MMKQISWKMKVTIWYTFFVVLITGFAMFSITRYATLTFAVTHEEELEEAVDDFVEDMDIDKMQELLNGYQKS